MQVTDEMVRVAAESICNTLFGPFDAAELGCPTSISAQSKLAARAALTAALAAMWRPIGEAPKDRGILARRDNGVSYEFHYVWWDDSDEYYPWRSEDNAYPEHRLDEFTLLPSPPTQTGG